MNRPNNESNRLKAEDFRRLGVRVEEWRPTIIRQAAARTASGVAQRQLKTPSDINGRELSRITVSAYRVLDPRRRDDSTQRASIGRILPVALSAASRARFCNGRPDDQVVSTLALESADLLSEDEDSDTEAAGSAIGFAMPDEQPSLDFSGAVPSAVTESTVSIETAFDPTNVIAGRLESDSLLRQYPFKRRIDRLRRVVSGPVFVAGLFGVLVLATLWVTQSTRTELASPVGALEQAAPDVASVDLDPVQGTPAQTSLAETELSAPDMIDPVVAVDQLEGLPSVDDERTASKARQSEPTDDAAIQQGKALIEQASKWAQEMARSIDKAFASAKQNEKPKFLPDPFQTPVPVVVDPVVASPAPDSMANDRVGKGSAPAKGIGTNGPTPVPSETESKEALGRLRQRLPELAETVSQTNAAKLIVRLSELQTESKPGSIDYWTAGMAAAHIEWSVSDAAQVRKRLQAMADAHQIAVEPLMADSFLHHQVFVETQESHRKLLQNGFSVAESLLRYESLQACERVVALTKRSAEFLQDEVAQIQIANYEDAILQMNRLRLKANDIVRWSDSSEVNASDASIAGRYYCLFLRDWSSGLAWLARSKDPRLAPLAQSEQELLHAPNAIPGFGATEKNDPQSADGQPSDKSSPAITATQLSALAQRWFAVASRHDGRIAESMRLHALQLNERAEKSSRGTQKLKIQRDIDKIRKSLSNFTSGRTPFAASAFRML